MSKIRVFHFHNGSGGGVLSVIKNLLKYSRNKDMENHVIFTINKDLVSEYKMPDLEGAKTQQVFYFSAKWNFYYTCRQLAKLLPDDKAVVIAHDWLELGMMSNLGLQNPVVQFVHGDYEYYYILAEKHEKTIDLFIPVAENIERKLIIKLPHRINDIAYLRFPVPDVPAQLKERPNNIIFIGRLDAAKGYPLLAEIANKLSGIKMQWHIVGNGEDENKDNNWNKNIEVKFYGSMPNFEVLKLLPKMKMVILPSLAEGMPVVIIEAMKAGVVPIVNDLPGGIQELVIDGETGFKIKNNSIETFVQKINEIVNDKALSIAMQQQCMSLAKQFFNPKINTWKIEDQFEKLCRYERKIKLADKTYGSRLDESWIPNSIVKTLRK